MPDTFSTGSNAAARALSDARSTIVFCREHPLAAMRARLDAAGFHTAAQLRRLEHGTAIRVAGMNVMINTPPTRSGRRMMFVTIEDETGLIDLTVFEDLQARSAKAIMTSQILAVEGVLQREGRLGRSITVTVHRVLPVWSGALTELLAPLAVPSANVPC